MAAKVNRHTRSTSNRQLTQAISNFDFATFLASHGIETHYSGTQLAGMCPFQEHNRESFYVHPDSGVYICHTCGESGNAVQLVAQVAEVSYQEAVKVLAEAGTVYLYDEDPPAAELEPAKSGPARIGLPHDFEPLELPVTTGTQRFWRYAKTRNLTPELIAKYGIGFSRFAGRLIVPVTSDGEVVTYVARDITNRKEKKIDTPFGNDQKSYLFNLDHLIGKTVIIVLMEGVFDALMVDDKAVASFGKSISSDQIDLLIKAGIKEVWVCWDEDATEEIMRVVNKLSPFFVVKTIGLPSGKDPNKLGPLLMREMLKAATTPSSADKMNVFLR